MRGLRCTPIAVASSCDRGHLRQRRQRLEIVGAGPHGGQVGLARNLRAAPSAPASVRARRGEPRLALADVGAGHLADLEAVAGRVQRLVQPLHVVARQPHELLVAAHVDVGLHRVEEHQLLDVLEVGPSGGDQVARRLDRRLGVRRCRRCSRRRSATPASWLSWSSIASAVVCVVQRTPMRRPAAGARRAPAARSRRAPRSAARFDVEQRAGLVGLDQRIRQPVGRRRSRARHGQGRPQPCSTRRSDSQ